MFPSNIQSQVGFEYENTIRPPTGPPQKMDNNQGTRVDATWEITILSVAFKCDNIKTERGKKITVILIRSSFVPVPLAVMATKKGLPTILSIKQA